MLLKSLILALLYFILGKLAFSLAVTHSTVTSVVFMPEGVALAFAILFGWPIMGGVLLGQVILAVSTGLPFKLAIEIGIINSLEAMLGGWLFHRLKLRVTLDRPKEIMLFVMLVSFILQPFSAISGTTCLWLGGRIPTEQISQAMSYWWFGNVMGQILVTPLILSWRNRQQNQVNLNNLILPILAFITIAGTAFNYFSIPFLSHPLFVIAASYPLLTWIATRFGLQGVTVANIAIVALVLQATLMGLGLFASEQLQDRLVYLNVFIFGTCIASLLMAATSMERKELLHRLAIANDEVHALNKRLKQENLRMSAELDIARQLQLMILPKPEELTLIPELEVAAFMEPAAEVSGDYYDLLRHNKQVKIAIGDVTGHGLESGVLMLMTQTALRTLQESNQTDPVQFLAILNRTIYHNIQRINPYKSLSLNLLDYQNGFLSISGQHEQIIILRGGGKLELIDTQHLGFPIGLEEEIADLVGCEEVVLNAGDVVVLYTDGVTEAFNINQSQYGLDRLCEVVKGNSYLSAEGIRQAIIEDLRRHIGDQKVFDDITLLVLKQK